MSYTNGAGKTNAPTPTHEQQWRQALFSFEETSALHPSRGPAASSGSVSASEASSRLLSRFLAAPTNAKKAAAVDSDAAPTTSSPPPQNLTPAKSTWVDDDDDWMFSTSSVSFVHKHTDVANQNINSPRNSNLGSNPNLPKNPNPESSVLSGSDSGAGNKSFPAAYFASKDAKDMWSDSDDTVVLPSNFSKTGAKRRKKRSGWSDSDDSRNSQALSGGDVEAKGARKRKRPVSNFDEESFDLSDLDEDDMCPRLDIPLQGPELPLQLDDEIYVPSAINRYLRPYQQQGVVWMWNQCTRTERKAGCILADDMGLGKTVQIIGLFAAVLRKSGTRVDSKSVKEKRRMGSSTKPMLVVAPASVVGQWKQELARWGKFAVILFQVKYLDSTIVAVREGRVEVVLCSYAHMSHLSSVVFEIIVFDEFHLLKNPKAARTISARNLQARARIGLTGTPVQNNLEEFWCLLNIIDGTTFASLKDFKHHFSNTIKRSKKRTASEEAVARGKKIEKELRHIIKKYLLRREKSVIASDLKGKDEIVLFCHLSPVQKALYQHVLTLPDFRNVRLHHKTKESCSCKHGLCKHVIPLDDEGNIDETAVLWKRNHQGDKEGGCEKCPTCLVFPCLQILSNIANHPFLLQVDELDPNADRRKATLEFAQKAIGRDLMDRLGGNIRSQKFTEASRSDICGKMETLDRALQKFNSKGDRVLLFSCSTRVLDLLQAFVKSKGYSHLRLDGSTPVCKRQSICDTFNSTDDIFILLISTRAGGLGLNLVSANKVIVFDVNWNPSYDKQAQDRAFRIGQQRRVQVLRLVSQGTLEEMCYMRQIYKTQLVRTVTGSRERERLFEGVEKEEHGELFGIQNLMQYSDNSILKILRASLGPSSDQPCTRSQNDSHNAIDIEGVSHETEASVASLVQDAFRSAIDRLKSLDSEHTQQENDTENSETLDPVTLLGALGFNPDITLENVHSVQPAEDETKREEDLNVVEVEAHFADSDCDTNPHTVQSAGDDHNNDDIQSDEETSIIETPAEETLTIKTLKHKRAEVDGTSTKRQKIQDHVDTTERTYQSHSIYKPSYTSSTPRHT